MNDESHDRDPSKCPRNKADGTPCGNGAGKGTKHLGMGPCYKHGGRNVKWDTHFETQMATNRMRTYGAPIDTDPQTALMDEVQRTAGHVAWLGAVVAELQHDGDGYIEVANEAGERVFVPRSGLKQLDAGGRHERPSVWVELYQTERTHLARVCKMAIDAGVSQALVDIARENGRSLGEWVRNVLFDPDLQLTETQKEVAKSVLMKHLQKTLEPTQ